MLLPRFAVTAANDDDQWCEQEAASTIDMVVTPGDSPRPIFFHVGSTGSGSFEVSVMCEELPTQYQVDDALSAGALEAPTARALPKVAAATLAAALSAKDVASDLAKDAVPAAKAQAALAAAKDSGTDDAVTDDAATDDEAADAAMAAAAAKKSLKPKALGQPLGSSPRGSGGASAAEALEAFPELYPELFARPDEWGFASSLSAEELADRMLHVDAGEDQFSGIGQAFRTG